MIELFFSFAGWITNVLVVEKFFIMEKAKAHMVDVQPMHHIDPTDI